MVVAGRGNPTLGDRIAEKLAINLGGVLLKTFANGETYCRYEESIRGADVFIIQSPSQRLNDDVMAVGGARGMSTFYGYYVLQARARAGDVRGCLECIREYWGGMLALGATTFWEDFDIEWAKDAVGIDELVPEGARDIHGDFGNYCYKGFRHSLCHGWASGPTAWLSEPGA